MAVILVCPQPLSSGPLTLERCWGLQHLEEDEAPLCKDMILLKIESGRTTTDQGFSYVDVLKRKS